MVIVKAGNAEQLMMLVNKNEEALVRIQIVLEPTKWVGSPAHLWTCYDYRTLLCVVLAVVTTGPATTAARCCVLC